MAGVPMMASGLSDRSVESDCGGLADPPVCLSTQAAPPGAPAGTRVACYLPPPNVAPPGPPGDSGPAPRGSVAPGLSMRRTPT